MASTSLRLQEVMRWLVCWGSAHSGRGRGCDGPRAPAQLQWKQARWFQRACRRTHTHPQHQRVILHVAVWCLFMFRDAVPSQAMGLQGCENAHLHASANAHAAACAWSRQPRTSMNEFHGFQRLWISLLRHCGVIKQCSSSAPQEMHHERKKGGNKQSNNHQEFVRSGVKAFTGLPGAPSLKPAYSRRQRLVYRAGSSRFETLRG